MVLENRSEFVVLYDAKNCNPNGDPLSPTNEPRIDASTKTGLVSPGRIKRYVRDQMYDEGNNIFVRKPSQYTTKTEDIKTVADVWEEVVDEMTEKGLDIEEEDVDSYMSEFMNYLMDVRFFGNVFADAKPSSVKGPVQIQVGTTLNNVQKNQATSQITGALSTSGGDGSAIGTDERIYYGLYAVDGEVNENAAENTFFTQEDVEYLDGVLWRSLVSQTHSSSKSGQAPRLYVRVEYSTPHFQISNLSEYISLDPSTDSETDIRTVNDYELDISDLVTVLNNHSEHIETICVETDYALTLAGSESLKEALEHDEYTVTSVNPYEGV